MSSKSQVKSATRTLYTPVFYATPQSSASIAPQTKIPNAYLEHLSRKHIALAQIVQDVPSSRYGSPVEGEGEEDAAYGARVDALRIRVRKAFEYANGDTADGKWSLLVQLLRLTTTRGRPRWIGTTVEGKKPESSNGWINAQTEAEWMIWERKWNEEHALKQKVESWQRKVDANPPIELASAVSLSPNAEKRKVTTAENEAVICEPVKVVVAATPSRLTVSGSTGTILGFPVMKRSSLTTLGKPKPTISVEPLTTKTIPNSRLNNAARRLDTNLPIDSSSPPVGPPAKGITDISETSFLPPSFPSHLNTSTPKQKSDSRHKPSPIPPGPFTSPLSSLQNDQVYGRRQPIPDSSSSAPALPSTPTRYPRRNSPSPQMGHCEKRARSVTPEYAQKRTRTLSNLDSLDRPLPLNTPSQPVTDNVTSIPMATPKRQQLPTLTELLASAKRTKASPKGKGKGKRMLSPTMVRDAPRSKSMVEEENEPHIPQRPSIFTGAGSVVEEGNEPHIPQRPSIFTGAGSVVRENSSYAMALDPGDSSGYDMASPTKSLSSLAASDSDEDEGHPGDDVNINCSDEFNPPFVSTQVGAVKETGSGFGWLGYNSQFDVDGKVDMVSKFMEKDVDYDGWLRDPSLEPEDIGSQ